MSLTDLVDMTKLQTFVDTHHTRSQSKDTVFEAIALMLGTLGTCDRARVGAVLVRDGRCISWGFNGAPPGLPHCSENGHGHGLRSQESRFGEWDSKMAREGCRNATHAEANALAFAAREGISTESSTLYASISPCDVCARLLIAAGITRVVYAEAYRDPRGVDLLREAGVTVG